MGTVKTSKRKKLKSTVKKRGRRSKPTTKAKPARKQPTRATKPSTSSSRATKTPANTPGWWQALVDDPRPAEVKRHLAFLCETQACRDILEQLARLVTSVRIGTHKYNPQPNLRLTLVSADGKEHELAVGPPEPARGSVPPSFGRLLQIAGGLSLDLYDYWGFYLNEGGDLLYDDWEPWFEEYAPEFLGTPVTSVITRGSDQFVFHPTLRRKNGEAQIVWMAHDGGGIEHIPEPELGAGAIFLRVLREHLLTGRSGDWFI